MLRGPSRDRWGDDAASGQRVAFLVGLARLAAVVAAALLHASPGEKHGESDGPDLRAKALMAVLRLASAPGVPAEGDARGERDSPARGLAVGEETPLELSRDEIALLTSPATPATGADPRRASRSRRWRLWIARERRMDESP